MNAKRMLAAAMALALALGLTACSSAPAPETPEEVLVKAHAAMNDVTSLGYDMTMDMVMETDLLEDPIEVTTLTQVDTILDPLSIKAEMDLNMDALGESTHMLLYVLEQDGSYLVTTGTVGEDGATTWDSTSTTDSVDLKQLDGKASMDVYLSSAKSFTEGGTETINGTEATRYDGVIAGSDLEEVLDASGTLEQLNNMGMGDVGDLLMGLSDLPISLWIAKDTYYPVQYEMDMTAMMQTILEKSLAASGAADLGITLSQLTLSMTLRDFNSIPEIALPNEAITG